MLSLLRPEAYRLRLEQGTCTGAREFRFFLYLKKFAAYLASDDRPLVTGITATRPTAGLCHQRLKRMPVEEALCPGAEDTLRSLRADGFDLALGRRERTKSAACRTHAHRSCSRRRPFGPTKTSPRSGCPVKFMGWAWGRRRAWSYRSGPTRTTRSSFEIPQHM